jgi:hypothetical protein
MTLYCATSKGNIPFTEEQEAEWLLQAAVYEKENPKILIKEKIANLEATITPRRTREAILAIDTTWLADVELQIEQLRQQLAEL